MESPTVCSNSDMLPSAQSKQVHLPMSSSLHQSVYPNGCKEQTVPKYATPPSPESIGHRNRSSAHPGYSEP